MDINHVNQIFKEHFGPVPHDSRREKKAEEPASEIVADQERPDDERAGRRWNEENFGQFSGLTKRGKVKNDAEK